MMSVVLREKKGNEPTFKKSKTGAIFEEGPRGRMKEPPPLICHLPTAPPRLSLSLIPWPVVKFRGRGNREGKSKRFISDHKSVDLSVKGIRVEGAGRRS